MHMTRRTAMVLAAGTAASLAAPRLARAAAPFEQPPLPYAEDALAPAISARTVGLHYGKHHAGYFTKLNERVQGTPYADMTLEEVVAESGKADDQEIFSQAGQAWNHILYWDQFAGGPVAPEGAFAEAVERDFGGLDALKEAIGTEAGKVFGTGWVWLVDDGGTLALAGMEDAGNPVPEGRRTLMGIDVWEHAYYLDYENRKAEHITAVLNNLVNWQFVGERMAG
jgi:superoxide dismutase, Fe-Mn family